MFSWNTFWTFLLHFTYFHLNDLYFLHKTTALLTRDELKAAASIRDFMVLELLSLNVSLVCSCHVCHNSDGGYSVIFPHSYALMSWHHTINGEFSQTLSSKDISKVCCRYISDSSGLPSLRLAKNLLSLTVPSNTDLQLWPYNAWLLLALHFTLCIHGKHML